MGEMKIIPKKKIYITLWILMGLLVVFMFWLVFQLLISYHKIFFGIGTALTFLTIVFIYIKSVLNYYQLVIEGDHLYVIQFGKSLGNAFIKNMKFESDVTNAGNKKYTRILFELESHKIVVTNFEHDGFNRFYELLVKKKRLKHM